MENQIKGTKTQGQDLKILLIEDETQLRLTIKDVLEIHGFQVITASNGRHGVNLAMADPPDVIICDITMPNMDGYEVVKAIRKQAELDLVPFIFLTAKHTYADIRKGMNLGADDYLVKPFHNKDLIEVIHIRLSKNNRLRKAFFRHYHLLEEYIYMNSHDIRGPLCNILGIGQLMKRDPYFMGHSWTQMLLDAAEQLDEVIIKANDMLGEEVDVSPVGDYYQRKNGEGQWEEDQRNGESRSQTKE